LATIKKAGVPVESGSPVSPRPPAEADVQSLHVVVAVPTAFVAGAPVKPHVSGEP
jgi:hypothetical protein